jgi:hypothetical protein
MTEQEIHEQAVDQILEIATAAAIATHSRSVPFTVAEICEGAMATAVANMVGDGGSQERLRDAIRMTLERWPQAVFLAHFARFGKLTRQ